MQTSNRLFDDFARVASGAMGVASGFKGEVEALVQRQFDRILARMDLVNREEFEAVKEMAAKARAEQEALNERLAALEKKAARPARKRAAKPKAAAPKDDTA
ncbi:MAG: accessory factor UbiK family protein [Proteobacteria bacterium]|nr:accessory factor UbiK family protein [Pseudomonadota bacterium]